MVTLIGLFLPYRLRVLYGIALNYLLNRPTKLFQLVINVLNEIFVFMLFFIMYFIILPFAWVIRALFSKSRGSGFALQNKRVLHRDFYRRF